MIAVLRQRDFALLWTGGLISRIGDWALFVALPIYVYRVTGSTLATSAMFLAGLLPSLLLGSVAGVFVDRWNRKRTMIVSNLVLTLIILPLLAVRSAQWIWVIYVVAFLGETVTQFFGPAESAMLPSVVGEEHLLQANSLNALHQNIARLLGPAIGGAVAAVSGLTGVALLDSVSFLLPAGMIALVHASGAVEKSEVGHAAEEAAGRWKRVWQEWIAGLSLVRRERLVATILVVFGISALGEGVFGVMFVVWVKKVLSGGALQLGWFMSAQAVGGLLGGLISGLLSRHFAAVRLAGFGAIAFGLLDMCLFSYPLLFSGVWIGLGIIALVGIPGVAGMSARTTLFQSEVRDEYRGRVFGMLGTTGGLLMIIGTLIAGAVGGIVGPIALLNVFQGGSYVLAGLVILIALGGLRLAQAGNERAPAASEL